MGDDEFALDDIDNSACLNVNLANNVVQKESAGDTAMADAAVANDTESDVVGASADMRGEGEDEPSADMRGEGEEDEPSADMRIQGEDKPEDSSSSDEADAVSSSRKTAVVADVEVAGANADMRGGGEAEPKDSSADESGETDSRVLTIQEYRNLFVRQNKKFGLTKIRNSSPAMQFVRPRVRLPNSGTPVIFVCEGVEAVGARGGLICPGLNLFLQNKTDNTKWEYVVIGCIWVNTCTHYTHVYNIHSRT